MGDLPQYLEKRLQNVSYVCLVRAISGSLSSLTTNRVRVTRLETNATERGTRVASRISPRCSHFEISRRQRKIMRETTFVWEHRIIRHTWPALFAFRGNDTLTLPLYPPAALSSRTNEPPLLFRVRFTSAHGYYGHLVRSRSALTFSLFSLRNAQSISLLSGIKR